MLKPFLDGLDRAFAALVEPDEADRTGASGTPALHPVCVFAAAMVLAGSLLGLTTLLALGVDAIVNRDLLVDALMAFEHPR
jgi:hypothetical protein